MISFVLLNPYFIKLRKRVGRDFAKVAKMFGIPKEEFEKQLIIDTERALYSSKLWFATMIRWEFGFISDREISLKFVQFLTPDLIFGKSAHHRNQ